MASVARASPRSPLFAAVAFKPRDMKRLTGLDMPAARMARAANEISHWDGYDYVVVNDDVEDLYERVKIGAKVIVL